MKRNPIFKIVLTIIIVLLTSSFTFGQLISPKDLAKIMDDENVIIISARKPADYAKVHVKGAVNVWHNDLYKEGEIKALLKTPAEIAKILGSKGISEKKTIVIYDAGKGTFTGRLYWILDYLGSDDVRILDGQMKMWRKARKPVTKKPTKISATTFAVSPDVGKIASKAYVKTHYKNAGVVLVDVRSKEEFDGLKGEIERKGRIPGAIQFEYKNVLNENGTLKSKEDLEKITKKAGIVADKEIILYCETSVRAGIVYMALASVLEFPNVKVYDGAFYEWSADQACPVE